MVRYAVGQIEETTEPIEVPFSNDELKIIICDLEYLAMRHANEGLSSYKRIELADRIKEYVRWP